MKIAIITDQHFGVRNNNNLFFDYFEDFYENQFFPYLDQHNIKNVINLGDHLDNRKTINVQTAEKFHKIWIKNLEKRGIEEHALLGNHTAYYRDTNKVNSLSRFYDDRPLLHLYDVKPQEVTIGGKVFGMVPWITRDNKDECMSFLQNSKADVLCGHFEIIGFYMDGGARCESGISVTELTRYQHVLSGHFHKKQTVNNISYLGSPYDMTYIDVDQQKGFHVFDTDTMDIEFIPNPKKLFHRFFYDDEKNDYDFSEYDFSSLKNCYVKIVIMTKKDEAKYEELLDTLENIGVYKLDIVETVTDDTEHESVDMSLSNIEIINKYIDENEGIEQRDELKKLIQMIHTEAMNV